MKKRRFDVNLPEIAQYDYRRNPNGGLIFSSVQELLVFLDDFDTSDCFFRGQSALWDITSSLYRHSDTSNFEKALNISTCAVEWLKENQFIREVVNDNDDYALAIAQHYGCPTDLVDITTNYRTAAYFAMSDNDRHHITPEGCIWVFPKSEIERLQDMMKTPPKGLFSNFPKTLVDKFLENNGNQLLQVNMPQLSRLNAQNGAFLWDLAGILKYQLFFACIGTRLVFQHTSNEKDIFTKETGRLFPFPNQLESEIMRIFKERKRIDGLPEYYGAISLAVHEKEGTLKNGLLSEIVDNAKRTQFLPAPDYFSPSYGGYTWIRRTVSQNNYIKKEIDMEKCISCHFSLSIEGASRFIEYILNSIANHSLTDLQIFIYEHENPYTIQDGHEQVLVDIIVTLSNYLYSTDEIAEVILEWIKMQTFRQNNGYITNNEIDHDIVLIDGDVNNWVAKYYGCRVTKLNLREGDGIARFWLPENYSFLDEECQKEFSEFDQNCYEIPKIIQSYCEDLPDNAKIFIYQHKPQKIMSHETMKRMFIDLILPQHFAFRNICEAIYIPDYITTISLSVFGRQIYFSSDGISESADNVVSLTVI